MHPYLRREDTGVRSGVSAVPEENPCHLIYFLMSFLDMALLFVFLDSHRLAVAQACNLCKNKPALLRNVLGSILLQKCFLREVRDSGLFPSLEP